MGTHHDIDIDQLRGDLLQIARKGPHSLTYLVLEALEYLSPATAPTDRAAAQGLCDRLTERYDAAAAANDRLLMTALSDAGTLVGVVGWPDPAKAPKPLPLTDAAGWRSVRMYSDSSGTYVIRVNADMSRLEVRIYDHGYTGHDANGFPESEHEQFLASLTPHEDKPEDAISEWREELERDFPGDDGSTDPLGDMLPAVEVDNDDWKILIDGRTYTMRYDHARTGE